MRVKPARPRNVGFDVVKGFLVLIMVVHHSLEYTLGHEFHLIKYFDFVTGGFVFVSGFIAAFLRKDSSAAPSTAESVDLIYRAAKLLGLFLFVNFLLGLVGSTGQDGVRLYMFGSVKNVYSVLGPGSKPLSAFEILVPIAYTIFFIGALRLFRVPNRWFGILALGLIVACTILADPPFNLYHLSLGLAGAALGLLISPRFLNDALESRRVKLWSALAATIYFCAISAIRQDNAALYVFGIIAVTLLVYACHPYLRKFPVILDRIVQLGVYSLLAYFAHIAFLQVLFKIKKRLDLEFLPGIPLVMTIAFVLLFCFGVDQARRRYDWCNRVYAFLFK